MFCACSFQGISADPNTNTNAGIEQTSSSINLLSSSSGGVFSTKAEIETHLSSKETLAIHRDEYGSVRLVAYFPSYRNLNQVNFQALTHICWSFANPNSAYSFTSSNKMKSMVNKALESQVKPMLSVGGGGLSPSYQKHWAEGMEATKSKREAAASFCCFCQSNIDYWHQ